MWVTVSVFVVQARVDSACSDAPLTFHHQGTDEQKKYFLPRLADGTLIPCFGLTGPHNGSDATALQGAEGIVEVQLSREILLISRLLCTNQSYSLQAPPLFGHPPSPLHCPP